MPIVKDKVASIASMVIAKKRTVAVVNMAHVKYVLLSRPNNINKATSILVHPQADLRHAVIPIREREGLQSKSLKGWTVFLPLVLASLIHPIAIRCCSAFF